MPEQKPSLVDDLKKTFDEIGFPYEPDDRLRFRFRIEAPNVKGEVADVFFVLPEDESYCRASFIAPNVVIDPSQLVEAYDFANSWNINKPHGRAFVSKVDLPGEPLTFVADSTFYANELYDRVHCLRDSFIPLFIRKSLEFFQTIGDSFQKTGG
ncbi:MAG: hypothetical protein J6X44_07810 [Thermoguttaceae bacterium]|nr:hypothetical protein [Thermoguttaceae bacterium]